MSNFNKLAAMPFESKIRKPQPLSRQSSASVNLTPVLKQAKRVMDVILNHRRLANGASCCESNTCAQCANPHLQKVVSSMVQRQPITFVLPAFPGKSPNAAKVLGTAPDMAEKKALEFLNQLCDKIQEIYEPGAKIIICSDGRVFSDVVGIPEENITLYQNELDQMISNLGLENLSTFNLDEICEDQDFVRVRQSLMDEFAHPLESLREKVRRGGKNSENSEDFEAHRMYCGITRFLFEDSLTPGQTKSRTSLQKESRTKAYMVILRSNAWSELIAKIFPEAVRLSIHPQACGSKKLGIQLLGTQTWLTPWHGVAVDMGHEFVLMKKWEAEELDVRLIRDSSGRASHYKLETSAKASIERGQDHELQI